MIVAHARRIRFNGLPGSEPGWKRRYAAVFGIKKNQYAKPATRAQTHQLLHMYKPPLQKETS